MASMKDEALERDAEFHRLKKVSHGLYCYGLYCYGYIVLADRDPEFHRLKKVSRS